MTRQIRARIGWALVVAPLALVASCSGVQQEADQEAARIADHVLPGALEAAISSATTPSGKLPATAGDVLSDPGASLLDGQGGATWVVRGQEGKTIRLDVYRRWESGSFFPPDQGTSVWGVACRSYDVAERVTSNPMECPVGTPDTP